MGSQSARASIISNNSGVSTLISMDTGRDVVSVSMSINVEYGDQDVDGIHGSVLVVVMPLTWAAVDKC